MIESTKPTVASASKIETMGMKEKPLAFCPFIQSHCRTDCAAHFVSGHGIHYCVLIDSKVKELESEYVTLVPLTRYASDEDNKPEVLA